jgi:hypothetical protein
MTLILAFADTRRYRADAPLGYYRYAERRKTARELRETERYAAVATLADVTAADAPR